MQAQAKFTCEPGINKRMRKHETKELLFFLSSGSYCLHLCLRLSGVFVRMLALPLRNTLLVSSFISFLFLCLLHSCKPGIRNEKSCYLKLNSPKTTVDLGGLERLRSPKKATNIKHGGQ